MKGAIPAMEIGAGATGVALALTHAPVPAVLCIVAAAVTRFLIFVATMP